MDPNIAILFSSCTKINLFRLSHNESYEVNLLLTTLVSSASHSWYNGGRASRCFVRLYEFQWIYHWDGWMEVFFLARKTSNCSFFKAQTFSDAIGNPRVSRFENCFWQHEFSCEKKMFEIFRGGIATMLSL